MWHRRLASTCHLVTFINGRPRSRCSSLSNTPGNPGNLLEIYKVYWKFSGLVCEFARLSLILVTILVFQSIGTKYLAVNQDQLILRSVISVSVI